MFCETDTRDKTATNLKRKRRGGLQPRLKSLHAPFRDPSAGCSPLYVLLHDYYCFTPNRRLMEMMLVCSWDTEKALGFSYCFVKFNTNGSYTKYKISWTLSSSLMVYAFRHQSICPVDSFEVDFLPVPSPPSCPFCSKYRVPPSDPAVINNALRLTTFEMEL